MNSEITLFVFKFVELNRRTYHLSLLFSILTLIFYTGSFLLDQAKKSCIADHSVLARLSKITQLIDIRAYSSQKDIINLSSHARASFSRLVVHPMVIADMHFWMALEINFYNH
uniref:Uncharacterized protein n=1 Tax=Glossina palpalis gambiensis TaxID=67801 RepID=A0A1B0B7R0_9MUSC